MHICEDFGSCDFNSCVPAAELSTSHYENLKKICENVHEKKETVDNAEWVLVQDVED